MSLMTYSNPISEIREQIERLFSDFSEEPLRPMLRNEWTTPGLGVRATTFLPPIEVTESEKELIVSASLPGIKPENINVEMVGNTLVISGEARRESKVDEKHFHRSEFHYGQFMRRIPLPDYVQTDQCKAQFNNGLLEVRLLKMEASKRKKIEVQTGK